jgi:heterodisulfide reductase subunit A-like polyferredoxin/coenzyme F420-reducing hydrogenase delta subunit
MPSPARVGVFLCQGGPERADSLEYKKLRWAAETGSPGGRLFEISQACQQEGAVALARLAKKESLSQILLGACPLAGPSGPLAQALVQLGLDPSMVDTVDVCRRPEKTMGQCLVESGAQFALGQALAALKERDQPEQETLQVAARVLVIGAGLAALSSSADLAKSGYEVLLLTPDKRLAPPEHLLDAEAVQSLADLEKYVRSQENITLMPRGQILGLTGSAGHFHALLRDQETKLQTHEIGAVVIAQGPPQELNVGDWDITSSPRLISLAELAALSSAPQHMSKLFGTSAPRVGLAVGMAHEADPQSLRAALRIGRELVSKLGAEATLFTKNLKVASPDLEEISQTARAEGVGLVKFSKNLFQAQALEERVEVDFREEILDRDLHQELDVLAVDQRPAPDAAYLELARCLGLEVAPDGSLQFATVNALPTLTARGGVFVVGPAQGSRDLVTTLDQVQETIWQIKNLLAGGQPTVQAGMVKVDRRACALCLTCLRVCPQGAMERLERRPVSNPLACTACGTCAAECPMNAIQILNLEDQRQQEEIKAGLSTPSIVVEGGIGHEMLVLACSNSAGIALRDARARGAAWPGEARLVQVPCAGKIDPEQVLMALREGFDAVLVLACHEMACYSLHGNTWASYRLDHLRTVLKEAGFPAERLISASVAPSMGTEAMKIVEESLAKIRELGSSPLKIEARVRDLLSPYTMQMDRSYTIL